MATKMLFGSVRAQLVGTLVAAVGGIALTACNSCCDPCKGGPPVYRKPCCAQEGGGYGGGGYMAPPPGQNMPPPPPAPSAPRPGGQMSCGAGKCG